MAAGQSCFTLTDKKDASVLDSEKALNTLLSSFDGSISQLFDAVFAFLAKNRPESFSSSGISLEHIISQSLHKWRTTLKQQERCSTLTSIASDFEEKSSITNSINTSSRECSIKEDFSSASSDKIESERVLNQCSDVAAEEIVEASNASTGSDAEPSKRYSWSQTMEDVDIKVVVPPRILKGKQLLVEIQDSSVYVAVKGAPEMVLLKGVLQQPVDSSESLWDLLPGRHVTVESDTGTKIKGRL